MALKINDADHPDKYLRIARIEIHRYVGEPIRYEAVWQAWHSEHRRKNGGTVIDNGRCDITSPEIAQAYQDLKLTFEGAIDI